MKKEFYKELNSFQITHSMELLFWLVVVFVIVAFSSTGIIFHDKNDVNDYQIFLQDADGLIVGSPVRMMGIEVGYITKIKPIKNEVYVDFVLTKDGVYVPQGTTASVEFSGMAGSKSLELYLPEKEDYIDQTTPIITVNPPKRLHDALGLLNDMMKKIGTITYTFSSFGSKLEENGLKPSSKVKNTDEIEKLLKISDKFLDDSTEKARDFRNSMEGLRNVRN